MRNSAITNNRKLYSALLYGTNGRTRVYAYTENQILNMYKHIYMYTHTQERVLRLLPPSFARVLITHSSQILIIW